MNSPDDQLPPELGDLAEQLRGDRPMAGDEVLDRVKARVRPSPRTSAHLLSKGPSVTRTRIAVAIATLTMMLGMSSAAIAFGPGMSGLGLPRITLPILGTICGGSNDHGRHLPRPNGNAASAVYARQYLVQAGLTLGDLRLRANIIQCRRFVALLPGHRLQCPLVNLRVLLPLIGP